MSQCDIVENIDNLNIKKKKKKHRRRHKNKESYDETNHKGVPNDHIIVTEVTNGDDIVSTNGKGDNNTYHLFNGIETDTFKNSIQDIPYSNLKAQHNDTDMSPRDMTQDGISKSSYPRSFSQDAILDSLLPVTSVSVPNLSRHSESHLLNSTIATGSRTNLANLSTCSSQGSTKRLRIKLNEDQLKTMQNEDLLRIFPEKMARIMVITWNMAGISDYPEDLYELMENSYTGELCDIYLFSFQETTSNTSDLLLRVQKTLGGQYVIFDHLEYGRLLCILVGNKKFIWNLAVIGKSALSTRITTITKGVVAISFWFFGSSILFMGSHFSSGPNSVGDEGKNYRRVEDYNAIIYSKELIKSLTTPDMKRGCDDRNLSHYFDHTFWSGDLNFRINRDCITVAKLILSEQRDSKVFEELLEEDELTISQATGLVFQEFEEGRIMFLPTYRFVIKSDEYNEKRRPSYTDRVLFRSHRSRGIECIHYNSVASYNHSDHKPVCAVMEVHLEAQHDHHLRNAGVFNKEIYSQCFDLTELMQKETKSSVVCTIV